MAVERDLAEVGREVVDGVAYMTLGTADRDGKPWASPVWFAHEGYREFVWVSHPQARHSRNIAERPEIGIVIFDSTVKPGTGVGVYLEAAAREVQAAELEGTLATFNARSNAPWSPDDVVPPARHRMYRATADGAYVLGALDERVPVDLAGP